MSKPIPLEQAGRIPAPGDNAAIAVRRLEDGTGIAQDDRRFELPHTVLEGHRFAVAPIAAGGPLLSWGLPFGVALRAIAPGEYLCNERILEVLRERHADFPLPAAPNFKNYRAPFQLDEAAFRPGVQVARHDAPRYFQGYDRGKLRGVGTRNFIVVLGCSSLTGSYARLLAERFRDLRTRLRNCDGVVAVAHTEGGSGARPHNLDFILRALAGFLVNSNVGAVLAVDYGNEAVTNEMLRTYLREHRYPLEDVRHQFLTLRGNLESNLAEGESVLRSWLEPVDTLARTPQSVEHLRVALQCGGSDAFSGVSGNPLAGWLSREVIRYGGSANLAETDELIGAEPYVLDKVRSLDTARAFLKTLARFQERASWHGTSAEGNPSGGNLYRGLYNITIKSIGAARKKDPAVRLDEVIDYAQPMTAPGFYFMDSPGNDLESIAGQVASGCNLILFTTGNGSITNFPFVPTIKIMTNSGRFNLLSHEMDVNAGRYLEGTGMDELGRDSFEVMLRIASGERSAGEKAGHSQVQLWREWRQSDGRALAQIQANPRPQPSGLPLPIRPVTDFDRRAAQARFKAIQGEHGPVCDRVGLIVPTSLCAGQVGRIIAEKLNKVGQASRLSPADESCAHAPGPAEQRGTGAGGSPALPSRFVALAHTEGCGVGGGDAEQIYLRTMAGYLQHPLVQRALLLEHGCEKTHNDTMRSYLAEQGIDSSRLGFASVQLDGGIDRVTAKVMDWFRQQAGPPVKIAEAGLESLRLGLFTRGPVPPLIAGTFACLARAVVHAGGTVVVPQNASLLDSQEFAPATLLSANEAQATLAYGQPFTTAGFHIMAAPTQHAVETLTGLGATGVEIMMAHVEGPPLQAHPLVPLLQIASGQSAAGGSDAGDCDLAVDGAASTMAALADELLNQVLRVASREYTPKLLAQGHTDFQMTRGWLGVSL